LSNILLINVPCYVFSGMARKRRFEPTLAASHPSHSAPVPIDEPTSATNQPLSPPHPEPENNDEYTLANNNATNKSKNKSMKYWTVDVRGT
jgi:hypothetical protein